MSENRAREKCQQRLVVRFIIDLLSWLQLNELRKWKMKTCRTLINSRSQKQNCVFKQPLYADDFERPLQQEKVKAPLDAEANELFRQQMTRPNDSM